ncbi:MAG: tRNA (N(6)-L-threonylcarbamoyladenosine(37)-C(2))-methylthiotransferase MtaB [Flavobacteriales bacterium]|nr:tRNA (N(6)-L-threonylcarbamoyladenosine(37)-C(2))-methylthiotransferase MtaB [Flavobacteriales bacterium]
MNPNKKVAFYTLGCKLNFAETSTIGRQLQEEGFARVEFEETPDVYVINTCSVTEQANKKCRNIVGRALRINPSAYIVVIGCYAQLKPEEILEIPGVDLVLGAKEKFELPSYLEDLEKKAQGQMVTHEIKQTREFVPSFSQGDRTRSFMKVQDGCNYFCSFCTIPLARGRSRSATIAETMAEARKVAATESRELVLTGVNIGDFGTAHGETFLELVQELDTLEGIDRIRISSIEPNLLSDEIIDFCSTAKRFVPHFHIPLQSGSDEILKKMRRRYLSELYRNRVAQIRQTMPGACIGVDVIVGFPGETDERFNETLELLKELDVNYFHVFTYSERPNTTAVRMYEIVPVEERRRRNHVLRMLSEKKKRAFYESNVGRHTVALMEAHNDEGWMYGFTENYIKVKLPYDAALVNKLVDVEIKGIDSDCQAEAQLLTPITT